MYDELGRVLALEQLALARAMKLALALDRDDSQAAIDVERLLDWALPRAGRGPRPVDVIFPHNPEHP